ncbi:MAG: glycoside hydrolase family 92 protein, partial [Flavobacteriales bacterium]|nr:glycoside hydrolase family 92 protein [Flavobacteriales bacterium]
FTTPNIYSDVNHVYRGTDNQFYMDTTAQRYTVFSLWDTFRATHPLFTLTQKERNQDFMTGFVEMYNEGGSLPMWELANNYTGCMIGYHSVSAMAAAYLKDAWNPYDTDKMLEAMIAAAEEDALGKSEYADYGYIPSDSEHESVSKTLEYAYNDYCIAQVAKKAGRMDIYERFLERSLSYRNLYDPETGFFRPRLGGGWIESFDPREVNFNFTEANAWQYNFFVPHDVNGHIELLGGPEKFEEKLDELFFGDGTITGRNQADITGLIGQYAHGNEPSHHMAFLYHYLGKPWKTQNMVDSILNTQYRNAPDGLSGNEDCGQMSSWYVLASMGLYPVCPGNPEYVLFAPKWDQWELELDNGKSFIAVAKRNNPNDKYIQSVTINGEAYPYSYISHQTIVKGGTMEIQLGDSPSEWGTNEGNYPRQQLESEEFVTTPIVHMPRAFRNEAEVRIENSDLDVQTFYSVNNSEFSPYAGAFTVKSSSAIKAYSIKNGFTSTTAIGKANLIDHDYTMDLFTEYSNQYHAGGEKALLDGIEGATNFKTGDWQGFYGEDIVVEVDLKKTLEIDSVGIGCLQDTKPWILYPKTFEVYSSLDHQSWTLLGSDSNQIPMDDYSVQRQTMIATAKGNARYLKLIIKNPGTLPQWHLGHGNPSWVFLDEIHIWKK